MSYRDPAARVPLIVHAPDRFAPRRVATPASLADLLPTLVDIVEEGGANDLAWPVDGRSLLPLLKGEPEQEHITIGEYLAEGAPMPMYMLRQGAWKFISCDADSDQLFNLDADPLENDNLAGQPVHAERVEHYRALLAKRFDRARIYADVLASQKSRLVVFQALTKGKLYPWDYQPLRQASEQYTRNHRDVTETDVLSRYPLAPEAIKKPGK